MKLAVMAVDTFGTVFGTMMTELAGCPPLYYVSRMKGQCSSHPCSPFVISKTGGFISLLVVLESSQ